MPFFLVFLILLACQRGAQFSPAPGDCVLGDQMAVWKVLRKDQENYLLGRMPLSESSPVQLVEDIRTFKKVSCPIAH